MEVSDIKIENSKGLRLSKSILEEQKEQIVIRPVHHPRKGWDNAFEQMHESGDDKPLMDDMFEDDKLDESAFANSGDC